MAAAEALMHEKIWFDKMRYDEAEAAYYEKIAGDSCTNKTTCVQSPLVNEIAKAREQIQRSLKTSNVTGCQSIGGCPAASGDISDNTALVQRVEHLERENRDLKIVTEDLKAAVKKLESRIAALEVKGASAGVAPVTQQTSPTKKAEEKKADDDDDINLFSDDEQEDEEAEKKKEELMKLYAAKKATKPVIIAKSSVVLDVKPWDDETDMAKMEQCVRSIVMDGLIWGASKFVPLAYTIKKLQIMCVVEDDKVSVDELQEKITEFEDYVQSVDIAAFNKI